MGRGEGEGEAKWGSSDLGSSSVALPRLQGEYKWVSIKFLFFLSRPLDGDSFLLFSSLLSFSSLFFFYAARVPSGLIAIRKLIARLRYVAFVENIGKLIVTGGNTFVEPQDPRVGGRLPRTRVREPLARELVDFVKGDHATPNFSCAGEREGISPGPRDRVSMSAGRSATSRPVSSSLAFALPETRNASPPG